MINTDDARENSQQFIQQACSRLSPLGKVYSRALFGGYGLCCEEDMFAVVSDGGLYLRGSKNSTAYFQRARMQNLISDKQGKPVNLNYYRVNKQLWSRQEELLQLAREALHGAQQDRKRLAQEKANRIKDLPNLNQDMEKKLWQVGITNAAQLKQHGAKQAYLLLEEQQITGNIKVLYRLAAAIRGCHIAVLPKIDKEALYKWWQEHSLKGRREGG